MKYTLVLLVVFLSIFFSSFAQDTSLLKRAAYKLTVAVDNKSVYEENLKASPYVLPNKALQLYPGETVYIEVGLINGAVNTFTAVKEIKDSSKTLIIDFTQTKKKKVHEMMMLHIANPFPYKLVYQATIFLLQPNKWVNTNVLP